MTAIASRLKDALWSIRRRYGCEPDIDRIIPFLVFNHQPDLYQLNNILISYPNHTPEDFKAALVIRIQQTTRAYWTYQQTRKGYYRLLKRILFLEAVVRCGFEGCDLVFNETRGYELELK